VLNFKQATQHPHNIARKTFTQLDGVTQPAPAPKMAHTSGPLKSVPEAGQDAISLLTELGLQAEQLAQLQRNGVI
jgi:alpha-methylacyl-CoA racemase